MNCPNCNEQWNSVIKRDGRVEHFMCAYCDYELGSHTIADCPFCNSSNWTCWDESLEWFYDHEEAQEFENPVGYLRCRDCGKSYSHHGFEHLDSVSHLGRDYE